MLINISLINSLSSLIWFTPLKNDTYILVSVLNLFYIDFYYFFFTFVLYRFYFYFYRRIVFQFILQVNPAIYTFLGLSYHCIFFIYLFQLFPVLLYYRISKQQEVCLIIRTPIV